MLFFDIPEYSEPATKNRQKTMATTTTTSQHYWRHFSTAMTGSQFYQEHFGTEPHQPETNVYNPATTTTYSECDPHIDGGDYADEQEPAFKKAASNRATTSNAERRYQRRSPPPRTTLAISAPTTIVKETTRELVQKPKTRAERRAIEPEQVEAPAEVLPPKRERRSDYWVQRDDERRNAARTFKTQTQSQVLSEGEDEELPW
jgi:hypothetical protein